MAKFSKDKLNPPEATPDKSLKEKEDNRTNTLSDRNGYTSGIDYADAIAIYYNNGKTLLPLKQVFSFSYTEDINNFYRTGKLIFEDAYDMLESFSMLGSNQKHTITVIVSLNKELEGQEMYFQFKMYNIVQTPIASSTFKTNKIFQCDLIEEPFFTKFTNNIVARSFKNMTAQEIILDILKKEGEVEDQYININKGKNDPIIPSFIVPFWSVEKCLKYLQQYVEGGPYKIFSSFHNQNEGDKKTYLNIVSLGGMFDGYLNNLRQKENKVITIAVSEKLKTKGFYPITHNFSLRGPTYRDMRNELSGESIMLFDYFTGKHEEDTKLMEDFVEEGKYKFQTGDKRYTPDKRNYLSLLGGVYYEGAKHEATISSGDYLLHEEEGPDHSFSNNKKNFNLEVESKHLSETKMHNRFYEAYYNQVNFHTEMASFSDVVLGSMYQLKLPSKTIEVPYDIQKEDEVFSGLFLNTRKVHTFSVRPNENVYTYTCQGTFSRSGIEQTNVLEDLKPHRKVDS